MIQGVVRKILELWNGEINSYFEDLAGSVADRITDLVFRCMFSFASYLAVSTTSGRFYQADHPVAFGQHHGAITAAYLSRPVRHLAPGEMP